MCTLHGEREERRRIGEATGEEVEEGLEERGLLGLWIRLLAREESGRRDVLVLSEVVRVVSLA